MLRCEWRSFAGFYNNDSFLSALVFPNELDEKEAEARIIPYMMVQVGFLTTHSL